MKDKHISNIFAKCLEAIEKNELSVEECLNQYPAYQDELRELLTTSQLIQDTIDEAGVGIDHQTPDDYGDVDRDCHGQ